MKDENKIVPISRLKRRKEVYDQKLSSVVRILEVVEMELLGASFQLASLKKDGPLHEEMLFDTGDDHVSALMELRESVLDIVEWFHEDLGHFEEGQ